MSDVSTVNPNAIIDELLATGHEGPIVKPAAINSADRKVLHDVLDISRPANDNIKERFLRKIFSKETAQNIKQNIKEQFTVDNLKKRFTLQAGVSVAIGAGTSIAVKAACVSALGTVSFPVAGTIIVSGAAAAALSAAAKIAAGHLYTKYYKGEEVEAFFTKKTAKAIAVQSLFGLAGSSVAYALSDQISAILSYAAKQVSPVFGWLPSMGGLFTKLKDMFEPSVPAPIIDTVSSAIPDQDVALPSFDEHELRTPTLDAASPKMPVLPLPEDVSLPTFQMETLNIALPDDAPLPEFKAAATLEESVPPHAADAQPVVITSTSMERLDAILKEQKNISPYLKERILMARSGSGQGLKDIGDFLYNGRGGMKANPALAIDFFREAAEKGNDQAKMALAYLEFYGLGGIAANKEAAIAKLSQVKGELAQKYLAAWTGHTPAVVAPRPAAVFPTTATTATATVRAPAMVNTAPAATQFFTPSATPPAVIQQPQPSVASHVASAPVTPKLPNVKEMNCVVAMDVKGGSFVCTGKGPSPFKVGDTAIFPSPGLLRATP